MSGVLLHLPDFISMESMGYRISGMPMSDVMLAGIVLITVGLPLSRLRIDTALLLAVLLPREECHRVPHPGHG
jgi:hypothetical protein